jgi:predicted metal-dependent hydrolase
LDRDKEPDWSKKLGIEPPMFPIRDHCRRWAGCAPKANLRFNWRIIQAPVRLADCVLAQGLVHLTDRHQTVAFWAM